MMLPARWLGGVVLLLESFVNASKVGNYSVQLLEGLAPAGWSSNKWAAVVDTMIGKTQAYILTDLIEDLAIKLKITDQELRNQIDAERASLGLQPLRPAAQKEIFSPSIQNRHRPIEDPDHISNYLPPGWTQATLESHTQEEFADLPSHVQKRLTLRLAADLADEEEYENPGILVQFSNKILRNISNTIHDHTRKAHGLPPGVRAYKRNTAPLVSLVTLKGYKKFGFVIYRTSYSNKTAFREFRESFDEIMDTQNQNTLNGDGLEKIERMFKLIVRDDKRFEGATVEKCRSDFLKMRQKNSFVYGLDLGVLLLVDEEAMSSFFDVTWENPPFLWAVDVDFDPKTNDYPPGYEGIFKVRPYALQHDLYLALGSGLMAPVDIWNVLQRKIVSKDTPHNEEHDEL